VNDNFGHLAGSTVLKEVGDILREIFHGTEAVCARYGGDEYTVILPGTGRKDAALHAEHIRANIVNRTFLRDKVPGLNKPLNIKGVITCSIGVASFREHVKRTKNVRTMADAMIRAADSAMYRAKELGKNRIIIALRERDRR
jgi:diguanylate cyclase (GGDEF)-like protein